MPSNVDAVVFIDANQYLTLYGTAKGRRLLKPLMEQQEHIFLTEQVVDEVQRNKLRIAARFLTGQFEELKLRAFEVPDHLFDAVTTSGLRQKLDDVHKKIDEVNYDMTHAAVRALELTSRNEDEVSKVLAELFSRAVKPATEELHRARERKERGNPPGKPADALGDQLTWEQLLGHCKGKSKIWIVSRDSDYCTKHLGKVLLNPSLYQDLAPLKQPTPDVFCFESIDEGIRDFVKKTGVKAETLLTPEESKEIKEELDSLGWLSSRPSLDWLSSGATDATSAAIQAWDQQRRAAALIAATSNQGRFVP